VSLKNREANDLPTTVSFGQNSLNSPRPPSGNRQSHCFLSFVDQTLEKIDSEKEALLSVNELNTRKLENDN